MAQLDSSPYRDDLREELAVRPARGRSRLTTALAAGVVLVAGILIGIQAGKLSGGATAATAATPTEGRRLPGGYGARQDQGPGQGGFAQRMGGGGTIGTVEKVEGGKVYVKTTDGATVTVTTTGRTTVQIAKPGKVSDLLKGATVTVRGQQGGDGSLTAASIIQGGQGSPVGGPR